MARPGSGNEGEAMVLAELVRQKFDGLVPFGEGQPYDLVLHLGAGAFLRIQCKTAWPVGGCMVFNSRTTDHGRGPRSYRGHADIFGVYFPPDQTVYLVPVDAIAESEGRLRLKPTRNNQRRGIRFADEFEAGRRTVDSLRQIVEIEASREERTLSVA